jgi:TolB protein
MKSLIASVSILLVLGLCPQSQGQTKSAKDKPASRPASSSAHRGGPPGIPPAEAAKLEAKFLANIRQITNVGKTGEGYFSPDGKSIIFQSIRGSHPFYEIFTKQLPDGKETKISTGSGRTTCSFYHPNGKKIIFASSHLDPNRAQEAKKELARLAEEKRTGKRRRYEWDYDPYMEIFEADLDGSNLRRLTDSHGYDAEGSYDAAGKRIVLCSQRNSRGDIYTMNADGSNVRQLTDSPGHDGGPFFSPDGKFVLFRGEVRRKQYLQVFIIPANGKPGDEIQLTDDAYLNWGPYFHPSGKYIIYSTSQHGHYNYELYLLDLITKTKTRVTFMPGADVLPVFSPDGKQLMWTSTRGKDKEGKRISELFLADWVYKNK